MRSLNQMKSFFVILLLFVISCENDQGVDVVGSVIVPFTLKVGQSARLTDGNLVLGFEKVLQDSRCPSDVVCVWEGVAELRLWLLKHGADTVYVKAPIYGYVTKSDTLRHAAVNAIGYRIKVLQLDPYPKHSAPPQPFAYTALISVSNS